MTPQRAPSPAQERAFLASVVYASVFDYPLTLDQLQATLIGEEADAAELMEWYAASDRLQAAVDMSDGYFFPRGRRELVEIRHARERVSRSLLDELRTPLSLVLRMPFVRMVALSGSLAHRNADQGADLDLFIVTSANRTWSVVVTLIVLARLLGWRRRLCLNYAVSERALAIEPRDLFSANQIVHLRPLCGLDTYERFLAANPFVREHYPNFRPCPGPSVAPAGATARILERLLSLTVAPLYERCCRFVYSRHLRRRAASWQSREHVRLDPECLKLHTSSHRRRVMDRFEIALAEAERFTLAGAAHAPAGR